MFYSVVAVLSGTSARLPEAVINHNRRPHCPHLLVMFHACATLSIGYFQGLFQPLLPDLHIPTLYLDVHTSVNSNVISSVKNGKIRTFLLRSALSLRLIDRRRLSHPPNSSTTWKRRSRDTLPRHLRTSEFETCALLENSSPTITSAFPITHRRSRQKARRKDQTIY